MVEHRPKVYIVDELYQTIEFMTDDDNNTKSL